MVTISSIQRNAYFFLLMLGAVFLIVPLYGSRAQTTPSAGEVAASRATSSTESIAEVATSTAVASPAATSSTPRPIHTGSIPAPLPVEIQPAEIPSYPSVLIPASLPEEDTNNNTIVFGAIAALGAAASAYGVSRLLRKNNKDTKGNQEERTCEDIKHLLEQKRKELENMIRKWPKEKLQEIVRDTVVGELKKNEDAKKILDTIESAKEKYGKLQEGIDMLQKKYDLCTLKFSSAYSAKVILVDAVDAFVIEGGGALRIFKEMHDLLETFPNRKIILTGADDEQFEKLGLDTMPYEVFTPKHNPEKTEPHYYEMMLKHFGLSKDNVLYFEHNPEAVQSAQSIGIKTYHYDSDAKNLIALQDFLTENL